MESSILTEIIQHCDLAIEQLRQAQERPDIALALLDVRLLLLQPTVSDAWDAALALLVQEDV